MTGEIGVEAATQISKRYSRLRVKALPTSAQADNHSWPQAHESPETVLIPLCSGLDHFALNPHE